MSSISLKAEGLAKKYRTGLFPRSVWQTVFEDISFELEKGKTFGLMGPSGAGKSTFGRVLAGLEKPSTGRILYKDAPVFELGRKDRNVFRRNVQMMFQDPVAALNPRKKIIVSILEVLKLLKIPKGEQEWHVLKMLDSVGLRSEILSRYPQQLSGGQNQRVALGRLLLLNPEFIILDEPTSALDVSVQAQILQLLKDLQSKKGIGYLFISHDEAVVRFMSDEIGLLENGKLKLIEA